MKRGVSIRSATKFARETPDEAKLQIEHLDWLCSNNNWQPRNGKGAWLSAAIRNSYATPKEFKTRAQREAVEENRNEARIQSERRRKRKQAAQNAVAQSKSRRVSEYLSGLQVDQRRGLEERAIREGDLFCQSRLRELEREGEHQAASIYREKLISNLVESILESTELNSPTK